MSECKVRIPRELLALRKYIMGLYSGATAFHSYDHIRRGEPVLFRLIQRFREFSLVVDEEICWLAWQLHDAGWNIPFGALYDQAGQALASKEQLSAMIARWVAIEKLGWRAERAQLLYDTIMVTNVKFMPTTPEQIIIRATDLSNLGGKFRPFAGAWGRITEELSIGMGRRLSDREAAHLKVNFLAFYLWPMFDVTPRSRDRKIGTSVYHLRTVANLLRIVRQTIKNVRLVVEIGCGREPIILTDERYHQEHVFYVAIEPDQKARQDAMFVQIAPRVFSKPRRQQPFVLVVPGKGQALPIQARAVDELVFKNVLTRHPEALSLVEVVRISKRGTIVRVIEDNSPDGSATDPRSSRDYEKTLVERFQKAGFNQDKRIELPRYGYELVFRRS